MKHFVARCSTVSTNSLVYHMGMHELQRKPDDDTTEALDYMNLMNSLLEGPHRHFILNMDQMLVFFCMTEKMMLEVIGVKTFHICTSMNNTKCATVAVTIATDGKVHPSMVVFEGKLDG